MKKHSALLILMAGISSLALLHAATSAEYYNAGYQMYQSGKYAEAAQYLKASVQLDPNNANAYYLLGNTYYKLGDKAAAITAFQSYLKLNPGNAQVKAFLTKLQAAGGGAAGRSATGHRAARKPLSRPAGSIVVFSDNFPFGVKESLGGDTKSGVVGSDPAYGRACLMYSGGLKTKNIGVTIDWRAAWKTSGSSRTGGDLSEFHENGALVFWPKGKKGNESFAISLNGPAQSGYGGQRYATTVRLATYLATSTDWQKVVIPLADFPQKGYFWDAKASVNRYQPFRWDQVEQIRFWQSKKEGEEWNVYLDELALVPTHDKAAAARAKADAINIRLKRVGDGQGNIILFDDAPQSDYSASPPPYSYLVLDETTAKVGKKSFRFNVDCSGYNYAHFGLDNLDLSSFYKRGKLTFWIKGKSGGEFFGLGFTAFTAEGYRVSVEVDIRAYATISAKWQKVEIPLIDFPASGSVRQMGNMPFAWKGVHMCWIEVPNPCQEKLMSWWLDDVKVMLR